MSDGDYMRMLEDQKTIVALEADKKAAADNCYRMELKHQASHAKMRDALERIEAAVGTSTEAWHIADAALKAERDERAEQVWRYDKVVEILAADNVALKEKCARLEDALEKQNKYMRCQEGSEEYPSEGCECEACNIQRLVDAALSRANQPAQKDQP